MPAKRKKPKMSGIFVRISDDDRNRLETISSVHELSLAATLRVCVRATYKALGFDDNKIDMLLKK